MERDPRKAMNPGRYFGEDINLAQAGREIQTLKESAAKKELQGLKPGLI
jgi:hypothetical protein